MEFDVTLSDQLVVLDSSAEDLETPDGFVYDRQDSDVLSLDTDAIAIAASYQYTLQDTLAVSDDVDVTMSLLRAGADTVSLTDSVAVGFVRWATINDTVETTDQLSRAINYNRVLSDTSVISDVIHTWSIPDDGVLEAELEGSADLKAVLIKRKAPPAAKAAPPPRTVQIPRPPKVLLEHCVVDPNPPNRRER